MILPAYESASCWRVMHRHQGVHRCLALRASAAICLTSVQRQPDWLFLSSWNEFIAQPQVAPQRSMGLETDSSVGNLAFVVR